MVINIQSYTKSPFANTNSKQKQKNKNAKAEAEAYGRSCESIELREKNQTISP